MYSKSLMNRLLKLDHPFPHPSLRISNHRADVRRPFPLTYFWSSVHFPLHARLTFHQTRRAETERQHHLRRNDSSIRPHSPRFSTPCPALQRSSVFLLSYPFISSLLYSSSISQSCLAARLIGTSSNILFLQLICWHPHWYFSLSESLTLRERDGGLKHTWFHHCSPPLFSDVFLVSEAHMLRLQNNVK